MMLGMFTILAYIVIGLIGGAIAKAILPGKQAGGIFVTMLLGIAGALLAGWLGQALFDSGYDGVFSLTGLLFSVLGALLILFVYGLIVKNKA